MFLLLQVFLSAPASMLGLSNGVKVEGFPLCPLKK